MTINKQNTFDFTLLHKALGIRWFVTTILFSSRIYITYTYILHPPKICPWRVQTKNWNLRVARTLSYLLEKLPQITSVNPGVSALPVGDLFGPFIVLGGPFRAAGRSFACSGLSLFFKFGERNLGALKFKMNINNITFPPKDTHQSATAAAQSPKTKPKQTFSPAEI